MPKANFDVEIAMDSILLQEKYDRLILFSGDGDFAKMIQYLRQNNKRIIVAAGRKFLSGKLIQAANQFITLELFAKNNQEVFYKKTGCKANPSTKRGT